MVAFDQQARQEPDFDSNSVVVALDYNSTATASEAADPQQHVLTIASNYVKAKIPLYPREQLDGLLELAVFLQQELGVEIVLGHDEIFPESSDPGPAFPLTQFRERLFQRTNGRIGTKIVTEQVIEEAILRNGPSLSATAVAAPPLKPGTRVSITEDYFDWVRVEVMQEIDGNPWLIGWLEARQVEAGDFEPVVRDNLLFTADGRQYKFVPALTANFDTKTVLTKEDIKFIVMHTTDGIYIQATVNYFREKNPGNVSAHLVIGRDGRVVQMVPFDRAAHHAGPGSWEGTGSINWRSIGIEVDNAGKLVEKNDGTVMWKKTIIPRDQWECVRYWKHNREKPWHTFPDIQKQVVFRVVKALAEHFQPLEELLEHERISLKNREDPGPLFPMEALRKEVLGREQPVFKPYRTKIDKETILFENSCFEPPIENFPKFPAPLPECPLVIVLDNSYDYWVKIQVKKCEKDGMVGRKGWVRKADVKFVADDKYQMVRPQDFYKDLGEHKGAPSLPLGKPLPPGTPVRVEKEVGKWSLIAAPKHEIGHLFLEGWVLSENLEEVPG